MDIKLIKILEELQSDVGSPSPRIVATENDTYLLFSLIGDTKGVIVKFEWAIYLKFGGPSEDSIGKHPYYTIGLSPYSIYKVENSDWIQGLEKIPNPNRNYEKSDLSECQHLIFFFHDSCFEVICENYIYELFSLPKTGIQKALNEKTKQIIDSEI